MGFFNILKTKNVQNQKRPLASNEDYTPDDFAIEDKSYPFFKRLKLKVLRCDGVAVGLRIPTLLYPLKKPKTPRIPFIFFGLIALILMGFCAYFAFYTIINAIIPLIKTATDANSAMDNELLDLISLGFFEIFRGFAVISVYVPVVVISLLLLTAFAFLTYFFITFIRLSACSIQEVAKGDEIENLIVFNVIMLVISMILCGFIIYGLSTGGTVNSDTLLFIVISAILLLFLIIMLTFTLIEKSKAKKEFSKLPYNEQEDFINHALAIKRVKQRIKRMSKYAKTSNFIN